MTVCDHAATNNNQQANWCGYAVAVPLEMAKQPTVYPTFAVPFAQMAYYQPQQVFLVQTGPSAEASCQASGYAVPLEQGPYFNVLTMPVAAEQTVPVAVEKPLVTAAPQQQALAAPADPLEPERDAGARRTVSSSTARRQRRQRRKDSIKLTMETAATGPAAGQPHACPYAQERSTTVSPGPGVEGEAVEQLMERLLQGGEELIFAIRDLGGSVWRLSQDQRGCRAVQLALEVATGAEARALVAELHGHVEAGINSPYANYVIQRVIETMPSAVSSFVAEEMAGRAAKLARHRYGCRVFCRLLEHSITQNAAAASLIRECMEDAEDLCRHEYGHYVMKAVLEHGAPDQKVRVIQALRAGPSCNSGGGDVGGLLRNAVHRNASYVLEKALGTCAAEELRELAGTLLEGGNVVTLGQSPHGCHVIKALMRSSQQTVQDHLRANADRLQVTRYGSRLLQELGLGPPAAVNLAATPAA